MDADYDFAHESELLQEAAEAADRRDYEAYGNANMAHDYFNDFDFDAA
jgi:hypothetical protein